MKTLLETLQPWIPFAFAASLSYLALSNIAPRDMKAWEPAFYSFLPMCFFFVGAVAHRMTREIRELRGAVAQLQASAKVDQVAA